MTRRYGRKPRYYSETDSQFQTVHIPQSVVFMRACVNEVVLGSDALRFVVRGIFDWIEIETALLKRMCPASTEFEREYFEGEMLLYHRRAVGLINDKQTAKYGSRWGTRSHVRATERRFYGRSA